MISEFKGNQRYYKLNKKYPFLKEYKSIFLKSFGIEKEIKTAFSKLKDVKSVYIFGSYAKDKMEAGSDLDILAIGNCPHLTIEKTISKLQNKIDREINVLDFSDEEFKQKIKENDPFISKIMKKDLIKII